MMAARMGRLKIVHVLDNLRMGGTELNAVRTMERLDSDAYEVSLLCLQPEGPLRPRLDAAGIPVRGIPVPSLVSMAALRRGMEIRALARSGGADVVHAHDPYANVLAAPWVRLAGRGAVIASHRWWRQVHAPRVRVANRLAYRFADRVLANSESVGELVVREEGVGRERLVVIPNFVDAAAFEPLSPERRAVLRARVGLQPGDVAVGVVANLYPVKNHAMLVRAAAQLAARWPCVHWVFIGEGAERPALEHAAREAGIADRVHLPGHVAHEPGLPGIFDIAVLASREEGFPNYVVEAMAAGRPIVATQVGGVADAVVEGETGLLVPSGDAERLAAGVATLLREPSLQVSMGAAGQRRARERYHADVVMRTLGRLYEELAASR